MAGCGSGSSALQAIPTTPAPALPTLLVGHTEQLKRGSLTAQDIANAQQKFGLDLMARVCGRDGPNTLISPASAADALGMLDAAAQGATASSVSRLLHLPAWSPGVVAAVHDHSSAIAALGTGTGDTLRTSNRVWPAVGARPTARFLDDVQTAYGASLRSLDFADHAQQATDTINRQVSKDTDGLIPRLFDQPLAVNTQAALTNAIVLKATWREPFLLQPTTSRFVTSAGATSARMMDAVEPVPYAAAGSWQAAQIPYQSGSLAAVAILPPKSAQACALPTSAQLTALLDPSQSLTSISLPRMHLDQTHDLLGTLAHMGLPATGDYTGLGREATVVSKAVQKDVMTVDELGTVAAGATGIAIATSAAAPPAHHLVLDRPFLLLLEDVATHTPLFLASIGNPTVS